MKTNSILSKLALLVLVMAATSCGNTSKKTPNAADSETPAALKSRCSTKITACSLILAILW